MADGYAIPTYGRDDQQASLGLMHGTKFRHFIRETIEEFRNRSLPDGFFGGTRVDRRDRSHRHGSAPGDGSTCLGRRIGVGGDESGPFQRETGHADICGRHGTVPAGGIQLISSDG